ncbi:MAG TPA: antitoxin MazE-like protein [Rhodopila sp.]|nr:antitoxin MazE-like protein [Rhodopila sp.]
MEARASSCEPIARHRASQRQRGLRPVVLWLPDVNDPAYRARLVEECRRLANLTREEATMAAGFGKLADRTDGWRQHPRVRRSAASKSRPCGSSRGN